MTTAPIIAREIEAHPAMAAAPEVAERPMRAIDPDRRGPELAYLVSHLALEQITDDLRVRA